MVGTEDIAQSTIRLKPLDRSLHRFTAIREGTRSARRKTPWHGIYQAQIIGEACCLLDLGKTFQEAGCPVEKPYHSRLQIRSRSTPSAAGLLDPDGKRNESAVRFLGPPDLFH